MAIDWTSLAVGTYEGAQKIKADRKAERDLQSLVAEREYERMIKEEDRRLRQETARQTAEDRQRVNQSLIDQRNATAADKVAKAKQDAEIAERRRELLTNPQALAGMTPGQRRLALYEVGVHNLGQHDPLLESPDEHSAHTKAESDAKWTDWQRQQDYRETQRRSRPVVKGTRPVKLDDPALPAGSQRYIATLPAKHGGDYGKAYAELLAYVQDPQTQADHPALSVDKAVKFLQTSARGGAKPSNVDADATKVVEETSRDNRQAPSPEQRPIPGIPGGVAELRNGKWIRVQ